MVPGYGSLSDANGFVGDYHIRRNLQANTALSQFTYGPLAPYDPSATVEADRQPHVFDTWHPAPAAPGFAGFAPGIFVDPDRDGVPDAQETSPPYIGYVVYPPRKSDTPPGPSSSFMPPPALSATQAGLTYQGYWTPGNSYNVGDVVFAVPAQYVANGVAGWDADGDGQFAWDADQVVTFGATPNQGFPDQAFQIAYRCIRAGDSGPVPPTFPSTPGKRVSETIPPGPSAPVPAVWESIDNRRPLQSMRLTIRFMNETSGEPRQLTLLLPLASR